MAQQVVIAGAMFNDVPSISVPDSNNVYHPFLDTTIASNAAAAADIAQGKLAYVNGSLVTGTNQGGGGGAVKMGALRPDAELVKTWSYDKLIHADEGVTIPSYSTTAQTLKASAALSPTYTIDPSTYAYLITVRCLGYPIYNSTNKGKGRQEYHIFANAHEVRTYPANMFTAMVNSTKTSAVESVVINATQLAANIYWNSGSVLMCNPTATTYGVNFSLNAPAISSNVLTINSPALRINGNSTYLSSTYWGYITDIRYQYIIELYRVPLSESVKGWERTSQVFHARDCVNSASHTLT